MTIQSKDAEIKARIQPDKLDNIMAFCRGRRIDRSEYLRELIKLGPDYFDHIETMMDPLNKDMIITLLNRLSLRI